MSYYLFDGNTTTDFRGFEANAGHGGGTAASVDSVMPGNDYVALEDAYRIHPDANGNRVYIDTVAPAAYGFPNNRAIKVVTYTGDGTTILGGGASGDVSRVLWQNRPDTTYNATNTLHSGGTRPADFLPAPAGGAIGFPTNTFGQHQWWGYSMVIGPSSPVIDSNWCMHGPEWHSKVAPQAPRVMAVQCLHDKFAIEVRSGYAGTWNTNNTTTPAAFLNRTFFFDETGFIDLVEFPRGGGDAPATSLVKKPGTVLAPPNTLNPRGTAWAPGQRYVDTASGGARGNLTKGMRYDFVFDIIWSDKDSLASGYFVSPTSAPLCATNGLIHAWMKRQDWTTWKEIVPATNIATCYSMYDRRYLVQQSDGLFCFWGTYRAKNLPVGPSTIWISQPKVAKSGGGVTGANVSFDGTDPTVTGSPPANTSVPTISGTVQTGYQLTAANGSWSNAPTSFAYRWQHDDLGGGNFVDIGSFSTGQKYIIPQGLIGCALRVIVTATNAFGAASKESAATAAITQGPLDPATRDNEVPLSQNGNWDGPMQPALDQLSLTSNAIG